MGNTGMDWFSCRRKLRRLDAEVAMLASQAAGAAPRRAARVSRLERGGIKHGLQVKSWFYKEKTGYVQRHCGAAAGAPADGPGASEAVRWSVAC